MLDHTDLGSITYRWNFREMEIVWKLESMRLARYEMMISLDFSSAQYSLVSRVRTVINLFLYT